MGKAVWTEKRIARMLEEGRGAGAGKSYRPFLEVTDLSSRGTSRRVLGHKTGRVHHLFSNVEYQFFLMLEWNRDVIDIREQFPLPRDLTTSVATTHRLAHPYYPGTKIPTVMTIDMVVTRLVGGEEIEEAYDIKRTEEAEDFRSIEKLEITRSACELVDIPHRIIFHSMLPETKIANIEWILGARSAEDSDPFLDVFGDHGSRFLHYLSGEAKHKSLRQCCDHYDVSFGLAPGSALRFARLLMYERALKPNLSQRDLVNAPLNEYQFLALPGQLRALGA